MLLIGTMASCALLYGFSGATRFSFLAAFGGLLFVFSDATLSIDAFHHAEIGDRAADLWVYDTLKR